LSLPRAETKKGPTKLKVGKLFLARSSPIKNKKAKRQPKVVFRGPETEGHSVIDTILGLAAVVAQPQRQWHRHLLVPKTAIRLICAKITVKQDTSLVPFLGKGGVPFLISPPLYDAAVFRIILTQWH